VAKNNPVDVNRNERILAYMLASSIGLSIIGILALLIGTAAGVNDLQSGFWPVLAVLPPIGLTIGFLLFIALIVMSAIRKSRAARDANN
jgi:ATP/ADP translocase